MMARNIIERRSYSINPSSDGTIDPITFVIIDNTKLKIISAQKLKPPLLLLIMMINKILIKIIKMVMVIGR
jgi:hypothetical protein